MRMLAGLSTVPGSGVIHMPAEEDGGAVDDANNALVAAPAADDGPRFTFGTGMRVGGGSDGEAAAAAASGDAAGSLAEDAGSSSAAAAQAPAQQKQKQVQVLLQRPGGGAPLPSEPPSESWLVEAIGKAAAMTGLSFSLQDLLDMAEGTKPWPECMLADLARTYGWAPEEVTSRIKEQAAKEKPALKAALRLAERLRAAEEALPEEERRSRVRMWVCGYCRNSNPGCPYRATRSGGFYISVPRGEDRALTGDVADPAIVGRYGGGGSCMLPMLRPVHDCPQLACCGRRRSALSTRTQAPEFSRWNDFCTRLMCIHSRLRFFTRIT